MSPRFRPLLFVALPIALGLGLALNCATTPANPNAGKYPSRPRGCKVRVYHTPAPDVKEWDDLGVAHVDCYLDVGAVQCLQRLKMEVCRLGGDIVYDVPKKPLRPTDQGMVYTGHVAHTKQQPGEPDKDEGADAGTEEPSFTGGPVQPLAPAAAGDAGASAAPAHVKDGGAP
jgi:hypothetical protein